MTIQLHVKKSFVYLLNIFCYQQSVRHRGKVGIIRSAVATTGFTSEDKRFIEWL